MADVCGYWPRRDAPLSSKRGHSGAARVKSVEKSGLRWDMVRAEHRRRDNSQDSR